jgi:hypothetical protein
MRSIFQSRRLTLFPQKQLVERGQDCCCLDQGRIGMFTTNIMGTCLWDAESKG